MCRFSPGTAAGPSLLENLGAATACLRAGAASRFTKASQMSVTMNDRDLNHWSLDRRIPIGLVAAIVLQTFAVGWAAAALHGRVDAVEDKVATIEDKVETIGDLRDRMVRVETIVQRIEMSVGTLLERQMRRSD